MEQAPAGLMPEAAQIAAEQGGALARAEAAPTGRPAGGSAPMPTNIPLPTAPVAPMQQPAGAPLSTPTASLLASDDSDLIEKEWVNKAKMIVERTRDDPYKQSEELTMVKIDYMKKRYNKTIKLNK
jgi:hypothetical protein